MHNTGPGAWTGSISQVAISMRALLGILGSAALLVVLPGTSAASSPEGMVVQATEPVSGGYVVSLKDTVSASTVDSTAMSLTSRYGGDLKSTFSVSMRGFALRGLSEAQARRLAADVTAYVLDSGIRYSHTEFEGRAKSGYDFVDTDPDANDCQGHGTHVSGTIGDKTWGVAKQIKLVGVKVLGCGDSAPERPHRTVPTGSRSPPPARTVPPGARSTP